MQTEVQEQPKFAIIAAVQKPTVSDAEFASSLAELRELAKTLGFKVIHTFVQRRTSFEITAYMGVGKRQEIRAFVNHEPLPVDADPTLAPEPFDGQIDALLVDHEISPSQARNLEIEVGCPVMDRTMVILEIFHRNARTRAARTQVEIARLGYMAPRLREAAKLAGQQGRQKSAVGGRGVGESLTELDRRKVRDRMAELQKEITAMDAERSTQRARRLANTSLASVALVGYTNAGKSTLMRALTGSEVLVANKLFATLDTTVRTLYPESKPRVLVSDTVGFIKNLPHGLVASFKSTLDESLDASLLLHVIDASDPGFQRQMEVTNTVLAEIGADTVPRLRVFNKIDHVGDAEAQAECAAALREQYPDCVVMSAIRPDDVAQLHQQLVVYFQQGQTEAEIFLPWSAQHMRGKIYAECTVLEERSTDDGSVFCIRGETAVVEGLVEKFGTSVDGLDGEVGEG